MWLYVIVPYLLPHMIYAIELFIGKVYGTLPHILPLAEQAYEIPLPIRGDYSLSVDEHISLLLLRILGNLHYAQAH